MSPGGVLVGFPRLGEGEGAVDDDADRAVAQQGGHFRQLPAVRVDLGGRNRHAQPSGFLMAVETQAEDREDRAAAPEGLQEARGSCSSNRVHDQVQAVDDVFDGNLAVVIERVDTEIA